MPRGKGNSVLGIRNSECEVSGAMWPGRFEQQDGVSPRWVGAMGQIREASFVKQREDCASPIRAEGKPLCSFEQE